ncbi:unnamed protein product [Urochloa decumbens]|uniref:Uncharacterized protein n=1 Tax=Urochloa decumbens TaxID=240449 RepID=A0ABC9GD15_9POAL
MDVAVASGILKIVGNKLVPLLIKNYSNIVGAEKDLQDLHDQVMEINNWLERVGDKAVENESSFNWLKELKGIAYEVDDIVDEFQLKAEKHDTCGDRGIVSKYVYTKPKSIMFQFKASIKINAIKKKFAAIVKQRNNFSSIINSLSAGHLFPRVNMTIGEMPLLPNIDAESVIGRDKEKRELISKLVEMEDQKIINKLSIIGLGGSGKTSLAKLVFNDSVIEKHFDVKLWVHVSHEFDFENLVGKLFEAISGEKCEQYPFQKMSKTISDKLTGKRYLLVLDNIWIEDKIKWGQFMVYLKSLENDIPGSGILLTTRDRNVADVVGSTYQFNLPFLSMDDSWKLFQQSLSMPAEVLELEFVEVGKQIVKKCGGVPLAIKVLAGILHDKKYIEQWKDMRDRNLLDAEGEECRLVELSQGTSNLKKLQVLNLRSCKNLVLLPEGISMLKKLQVLNLDRCEKLVELPEGIGNLEKLQFARISELGNVPRIGRKLSIRGISHVMDPNDAHMACLKQKTKLQRLDLNWMGTDKEKVNTKFDLLIPTLEQDVLDGLEPPPQIKELGIHWYLGRQCARWMQNQAGGRVQRLAHFPFLRVMKLHFCRNLKHLRDLVELPCLEELELRDLLSLESISGGPFPSLVKLKMHELPRLGEVVCMVAEGTMPNDGENGEARCNFTPPLILVRE